MFLIRTFDIHHQKLFECGKNKDGANLLNGNENFINP
jgi:hypothetical protein